MSKFKPVTRRTKGLVVELIREEETESPDGFFDDAETNAWVRAQIAAGNDWAWFCARVRVRFEGNTYLGACSYKSERDFKRGGYFTDMVSDAINDLNAQRREIHHFTYCAHCRAVKAGTPTNPIA